MSELHHRPVTSLLLLVLVVVGFAACDSGVVSSGPVTPLAPDLGVASSPGNTGTGLEVDPPDRRASTVPEEVHGHFSYGFEISVLEPCEFDEFWWVEGIPDELWQAMRQLGVEE